MDKPTDDLVATYFRRSVATMETCGGRREASSHDSHYLRRDPETIFRSGNKLMLAGNGGSAERRPAHMCGRSFCPG